LLNANEGKVVSVKYQTDWPGTDPMNLQNPGQVTTRVSYYNVSGVPDGELDGNVFNAQPAGLTQLMIDNRAAVPSPFTFDIEHSLSTGNDTIFINAVIKASQAVSGSLVAQMAVVERNIYFTSPPGTNGEKTFEGVMKRMLPTDQGTTLPTSWAVGDSVVISLSWKLANVYDINQLAVVGWVQDNATKEVHQAGYSRTHMPLDIGVSSTSFSNVLCTTTFTPDIELANYGTDVLTSCTINYKIDNGTVVTQPWTGSLAPETKTIVTLSAITTTVGAHTFTAYTTAPNAGTDLDIHNDTYNYTFGISNTPAPLFVQESFQAVLFPPTNWIRANYDNGFSWSRSAPGGFGTSTFSSKMDFYNSTAGNIDELYLPSTDMSSFVAPATLTFDVAYAFYTDANGSLYDTLALMASTDCGLTWSELWVKGGQDLSTAPTTGNAFVPTAANWRNETVDISSLIGQSSVLFMYQARSGYGNNCFIDNVNLSDATLGVISLDGSESIDIYPVPSNGVVTLHTLFNSPAQINVRVTNVVGQEVLNVAGSAAAEQKMTLDLSNQPDGAYFVTIITNKGTETRKINISR